MPAESVPGSGEPPEVVGHQLVVCAGPDELAATAARHVAAAASECVASHGSFDMAVSGGHTPWAMFAALRSMSVPWESVVVHQVDERFVALDDPDRNLAHLRAALEGVDATVVPMPVGDLESSDLDPDRAAADYASELPEHFDLVHLGLGPDGHTASLVPGDGVLAVTDRPVAVTTSSYQGHRRMTLTYAGLARARSVLWLVSGSSKADSLARLLAGDPSIPASGGGVRPSVVIADRAAVARLPPELLDGAGERGG